MSEKNCAFQYAKVSGTFLRETKMVSDVTQITLEEAQTLWAEYYPDCAKHIFRGGTAEMVIWINMTDPHSYGERLDHISTDAESDGSRIWETTKHYFPVNHLKVNQ